MSSQLHECHKCTMHGLPGFARPYPPDEFLEGHRDSPIWIIGLNPNPGSSFKDERNIASLVSFFDNPQNFGRYFNRFQKVSPKIFSLIGKPKGVAHTDIVKCFSETFPRDEDGTAAIANCLDYLKQQLHRWKPRIIICNGIYVCNTIRKILPPREDNETSYIALLQDQEIAVILSGFLSLADNYSKRRLGQEIEGFIEKFNLFP